MLKNKIIVKKIRNIIILLMAIIIMIGTYKNIGDSKAEETLEIYAIAFDNYGFIDKEEFKLEAVQIDKDLYEVELPESVNSKEINQIVNIKLEDINPEVHSENAVKENASTENTVTNETTTDEIQTKQTSEQTPNETVQEETLVEETIQEQPAETIPEETPTEENTTTESPESTSNDDSNNTDSEGSNESNEHDDKNENHVGDASNTNTEPETLEIIDGKIRLTKKQMETKQLIIEVIYNVVMVEKDEEGKFIKTALDQKNEEERAQIKIIQENEEIEETTKPQMLYRKILTYEDAENFKMVEVKGLLPIDAELQVEEVSQEKITEIFGEKSIDVAYDIKIIRKVVTLVPEDENNPESELVEHIEIIEIDPKEFEEKCEVSIKDLNIQTNSQVYHVKEDNTYEEAPIIENTENSISFEAETFSIYAVGTDEGIMTAATANLTVGNEADDSAGGVGIYWGTNSGIGYPSVYVTGSVSSNHNMLIELSTTKTDGVDGMTPGILAYADSTEVAYTPDVTGLTLEGAYYLRYKVWAKDTSGNTLTEYGVSNNPAIIDDVAPTAGTMTFKKTNSSGTTVYPRTSNPKYNTNIYMTINSNGIDGYGVKSTKYTVTRDGTTVYSDRTSYVTVSTAGEYVVTVTTTDYGGNTATRTYKFTIDKTAPIWNSSVYSQSVSGSTLTLSLRGSDAVALNTSSSTLEGKISSITVDGTAISTSSSATPYYAIGTSQTSTKYEIMHIYIYGLEDGLHDIEISIAAGALVDSAGNTSLAKTYTISASVDTKGVAPTWNASVSSATLSGTNGTIIVEGTDDVGLASSSTIFDSILVVNGTNNYLTSSNTTKINDGKYLISFSVPTEGAVTVELQIYQGALRDYAGNGSAAKTYTLSFYVDTIKPTWNASVTSSTVNEDICTIVVTGKDEKMLDMDVSTLSGKLDSITVDGTTIGTTVSTTTPYYELSTETASGNTDEAYTIIIHGLTTGTHSIGVNIGEGALVDKADTTAGVIYDSNRNTSDAKSYTVSAEVDITPPEWNASVDSSNISGDMCTIKITGTDETALNSSLSAISDKLTVRLEYTAPNSTTHVTTTIGTTVSTTTPYYELGTATTTTNSDGEVITKTFPITIRGLETGSYNVTIVVAEDALVDGFGNTSLGKTYSLQIDIDRSQPIWEENATIETHSTNESVALITITGTDETALNLDLSGITSTSDFTITVDGSAFTDLVDSYTLVSSSSTSMVYRFFIRGLSNGTHTIKISLNTGILVDLEGNVSGAKDYEFTHTINLVAPVWNTNITEKTVNGSSATIKVTGTDEWYINTNSCHFGYNNSNVTVKVNNTSTTEFTTGGWSQDTTKQVSGTIIINNLPDGENTISVTIAAGALADGAGNGSAAKTYTFTVIVDTTPPVWSEELWNIEYDESAEILNFTLKINDATSIDDSASTVSGNILVFQLNENGTTEAVWANTSDGLSVSSAGLSNNGKTKSWNVTINGFSGQRVKVILQSGHQTDTYGNTVSTQKEYDVVIKGVIPEWAPQSELTGSYNSSTNQWTVELTGKDSVGLDNSLSGLSQSDVTVKITRNNEDGTTTTTTTDFTLGAESNTTTTTTIPITINGVTSASDIITITIAKNTLTDTQGNKSQAMEYNFTAGGSYLISASSETSASSLFLSGNVPDRTDIPQRQNIESVTFLTSASSANSTKWDVSEDKTGSIVAWYTGSGPYQVYIAPTEGTKVRANPNSSYLFAHVGYSSSCTKASVIIGLDNLITTSVTNMNSMFRNCGYSKMTSLNLGTMSTTNVTRMISMFQGCGYTAMTNLDLGTGFDTSHVSMMTQMFYECGYGSLVEFTMGSNFNTSNVNSMDRMFYNFGHETLTSLNLGSNFNTSNVLWMNYMFYGCGYTSMTTLNLGTNFNTSSVLNFSNMFQYCGYTKLTSLDLGDVFYTDSNDGMQYMFDNCGGTAMTVLDMGPAFTNVNVSDEGFFMTDAGKSGNFTIYAPSSIFYSTTAFRENSTTTSTTTRTSGRGIINPIYRPKWSQTSVTFDSTNKELTVALKGNAYESSRGYASTVTSTLTTSNVTSKVDGTVADLTKTLGTKTTATENGKTVVKYTSFKLSNFPRTTTANGYWEYSGNVGLVFAEGTLVDEYGNPNLATDQNGEVILKTTATTKNTSDYMFADFIKPRVVTYSSSMSGSTQVILFDVYDKYLDTSDVVTADELTVLVDGVEQTGVTKTITNVADLTASVSDGTTTSTKTIGKRYTVNVTGFQNASTLIGSVVDADGDGTDDYVDGNGNASGTVSIQVKAGATKDLSGNTNDLTTINGVFVDKTKPVVIYRYSDTDIDTTNATVTIKFDITDKYYSNEDYPCKDDASEYSISKYLVIKVDGETIWNGAAVNGADVKVDVSDTLRELTDGTDIGRTCTITLSHLDDKNTKNYLDYSGVITVAIDAGLVTDTSGNTNDATTLTVGINLPEQTGTANKVVDVVKPEIFFHDGNGTSTQINSQVTVDPINNKVTVIFTATDKYFYGSSLQASDITAKIGIVDMAVDSLTSTNLPETGGHGSSIGKEYTLTLSGGENTGEVKITIPADKISDTTGNKNTAKTIKTRVIDLTNPTITVSPDKTTNASANDYVESQSVTITPAETPADNSSGLKSTNEYKYCLLESETTPTGSTTWTTYSTNGDPGSVTLGTGLTGTYYLYVKSVYDNEGNKSTSEGEMVEGYHKFGPYKFDNTAPTASLTMLLGSSTGNEYTAGTWTNQSVYISPNGNDSHSGVNTITYTVDGGSAVTSAQTLNPGVGAEKEYKVKVTVTDKVGNSTTSGEYIIKIDKKDPIVTITTDKTSRTNATSITYTFDWSESVTDFTADDITVTDFTADDITVTNGTKGTLTTVTPGTKYTMVVTYATDDVEVTQNVKVAAGAVYDKANNSNAETSKSIVIDHIDPEWKYSSKDIYYDSTRIDRDLEGDVGNDSYANAGRTAKIVFKGTDTNVHNVTSTLTKENITVKVNSTPISDSKKKLTVTGSGTSEVTATLIIDLDETSAENGVLSVMLPAGSLEDDVTDSTKNTNESKAFSTEIGITVDNVSPGLELKVTSPNNGNTYYRAGQVITITAKYTEQIYKEITSNTLIDTTDEAPAMKLSFGSTERDARCTTVSADKLTFTYTYTIQNGDNGDLKVKSLAAVYDAAGNAQSANNTTPQGYSIIADTNAPTITIEPPSDNVWRKEQTATVTITDDSAGLATGGSVRYGWSLSTSTAPSSYTTVALSNSRGASSTSFEATTNDLLGEVEGQYYLWVEPISVKDIAMKEGVEGNTTNTTPQKSSGKYNYDKKTPTITLSAQQNTTWSKTHSVTVTLADGGSGLDAGGNQNIKYGWSTSNTTAPSTYTPVTLENAEGAANTTFTATNNILTGKYYLWVVPESENYVKDISNEKRADTSKAGNKNTATVISTGLFWFDNTAPTITIDPPSESIWRKEQTATITLSDADSGLAKGSDLSIKYGWSTSTSTAPSSYTTVSLSHTDGTQTVSFEATTNTLLGAVEGEYYLWVELETYKDISVSGGNSYNTTQKTGTYYYDKKTPTISLSAQENTTWSKTHSVTVELADGGSGLDAGGNQKIKYGWSTSNTTAPSSYTPVTLTNAEGTASTTFTATNNTLTGKYYLWVVPESANYVKDISNEKRADTSKAGNKNTATVISTGLFWFDNTRPYWSTQNINIDKTNKRVTVDLIGTDAHSGYASNSLDTGDITIKVDGESATSIDVSQTGTGMEIKKSLSSASSVTGGVKYTLTLTNWEQISKQTGKGFFEWSGTTVITVAADTLVDNATNTNQAQDFTLGHVDFIQPKIENFGKTNTTNTQTITFSVFDKYMVVENEANGPISTHTTQAANVESDTTDEIVVYVDEELATGITKQLTTINKHTATINGATKTVGYDYQLVISGFDQGERNTNTNFKDYSGTVSIKIKANAIADTENNKNNEANYTGDFIDCIKPDIKYQYIAGDASTEGDINHTNETFTMVFDITDKYININSANSLHKDYEAATTDAEKIAVLQNYVTIKVGDTVILSNTVNNTDITKILSTSNITAGAAFNKTGTGGSVGEVASTTVVGKRYTLVLSNLDLDKHREDNSGNGLDYSGIITVALNTGILTDTTSNTNIGKTLTSGSNYENGTEADTDKIVDVVDPVWSATVKTIDAVNQKVTVTLTATDKYLDKENTTLVASDITSIKVDGQTATGVTVTSVTAGTTTTTTKSFDITLEGWEQGKINDIYEWSGTTEITIRAGTAQDLPVDGRYNTSNQAKLSIGHIDVIKPKIDQDPNPPIIVDQKQTIIFYVLDKYLNTSDEITENELEIEIGDAEGNNRVSGTDLDVEFTLTGPTNVTGGHQYTIVIDGFGNTSTLSGSVVDVDGDGNDDYLDGNGNASGTVFVEVKQGAATDMGLKGDGANRNVNDAKTLEGSFMDNTPPAVIYRYSQSDINRTDSSVTVKFDVTDKFYESSSFGQEDLVVKIDSNTLWNGTSAPTGVDVSISITDRKLTDNTVIGKTCTITITDFNQGKATGKSYIDYSGVITVAIAADVIKDNRNAGNAATSLTMGYKLPESGTDTGNNVEVDFIKPIWEASGYTIDKTNKQATVTLTGTDEFLNECTLPSGTALTDSQISVKVDGETASSITRKLSNPTYYDAAGNTVTGVTITNMRAKNVVKIVYTLTLSGWEQGSKQTGKDFFEWSGTPEITVAAGTLKDLSNIGDSDGDGDIDTYSYSNDAYTFNGTLTDFIKPKVEDFSSSINVSAKTETITFKIKDKYINSSQLSTIAKADMTDAKRTQIVNYLGLTIDNEPLPNSVIESLEITDVTAGTAFNKTVGGSVTSVPATTVIGYQYTLVLSNFEQVSRNGKNFVDYSGTVEVDIGAGLAKDSSDNTNNASNGNVGDFIDFVNPDIKYQYVAGEPYEEDDTDAEKAAKEGDTNHTNETFTMVFDITDKYINTNNLTQSTLSNYLTIKVDGVDITTNANVTKTLSVEDVTSEIAFNKTVDSDGNGTLDKVEEVPIGTKIGTQYTLTLSNLDLDKYREDNSGNGIDYSGVITLALKTGILTDTSSNTNANTTLTSGVSLANGSTSGSNKVVDVVDPVWSVGTPTINYSTQTVTVTLTATDKYLDTTNTTLAADGSDITVYVDGEVASSITKSVAVGTSTATTKTFTLTLTGWEQGTKQTTPTAKDFYEWSGTTIIKIAAGTARDTAVDGRYNLSNNAYLSLGHIDVIKPKVEDFSSSVDQADKTQTISFTIKDKYINASQLTTVAKEDMTDTIRTQIVNYLGLTIDNETLPNGIIESITVTDKTTTTAFSKTVNEIEAKTVYNSTGDVDNDGTTDIQTVAVGTRIGYTYTLILSNFEQVSRNGKNFVDYSGTVYMNIGANLATDKSRTKTPTGGALGNNAANNNKASFVDFVKPDIKYLNSEAVIDHDQSDKTFTMTFDITDKYFNTNNLTQSTLATYLTIKVDGVDITSNANVTKTLTTSDVESTVAFDKTVSGSIETVPIGTQIGTQYTLTLSNLEQIENGYSSGDDYSGVVTVVLKEGIIQDETVDGSSTKNTNPQTTITSGKTYKDETETGSEKVVDVVDPVWSAVVKNIDYANQKVTVTLTAYDKYLDTTTTTLTAANITLITVDGTTATGVTVTSVTAGSSTTTTKSFDITLEGWEQGKNGNFYEWSGTTAITVAGGTAKDLPVDVNGDGISDGYNESETQIISLGHIDVIKPKVEKVSSVVSGETQTIVFNVIDQFLDTTDDVTESEITVYVDGQEASSVTKQITNTTTVAGGKQYTLTLTNWEQTTKQTTPTAKDFIEWSGTVAIEIAASAAKDTSLNTLDNPARTTIGGTLDTSKVNNLLRADGTIEAKTGKILIVGEFIDVVKPKVEKISSEVSGATQTIKFRVMDKYLYPENTNNYQIEIGEITIKVDGDNVTSVIGKSLGTPTAINKTVNKTIGGNVVESQSQVVGYEYELVLSNFDKVVRTTDPNKNFVDYSGTVTLEIDPNAVKDKSGNTLDLDARDTSNNIIDISAVEDVSDTTKVILIGEFIDCVQPDIKYEYSASDINHTNETFTMVFDVTDKYIDTSTNKLTQSTIADYLTIKVDGEDITTNADVTKTLTVADVTSTVAFNKTVSGNIDTVPIGTTIGKQYTLVLSNLDLDKFAEDNSGDGFKYSGVITVAINDVKEATGEKIIADTSANTIVDTTLTSGSNYINETDANTDVIVDVVDPVWKVHNISGESITVRIVDKYLKELSAYTGALTTSNVTVLVNGSESSGIIKVITGPTKITDTEYEWNIELNNVTPETGDVTFTPENAAELIAGPNGFQYKADNSGYSMKIQIAAGVIEDQYTNKSNSITFNLTDNLDFVTPGIYEVQKTQNAAANTETIIFNVTDRNYDPSDLVTKSEIKLWIDNYSSDSNDTYYDARIKAILDNATLTYKEIKAKIDTETTARVVGHQYTLVVNNIAETAKQTTPTAKDYLEYSGTLKIEIVANAAKDLNNNKNESKTITDFVDFLKPRITPISTSKDATNKKYTMTFKVTDKYLDTTDMIETDEITVYIDGEEATSITKNYASTPTPIQATMNKTVDGTVTNGTYTIGHTYTLELSGFEQTTKQSGKDFYEWSGLVAIEINKNAAKDTTNTTGDTLEVPAKHADGTNVDTSKVSAVMSDLDNRIILVGDYVDFIKPKVENFSSSVNVSAKTETIEFTIKDKYIESSSLATGATATQIATYLGIKVDNEGATNKLTKSLTVEEVGATTAFKKTVDGIVTTAPVGTKIGYKYTLVLSGFEQTGRNSNEYKNYSGTVSLDIAANLAVDEASNGNLVSNDNKAKFVDFIKPTLKYTFATADIDKTQDTYKMVFDITDKYYTSGQLALANITSINIYNGKETINLKDELELDTEIRLSAEPKYATNVNYTETDGTVTTGKSQIQIGHTYTLTITNLDNAFIESGDKTANYSGVVTIAIAGDIISDRVIVYNEGTADEVTNVNKNVATSLTSGISVEPGSTSGSETVVDTVNPIWEKVSTSAYGVGGTATITVKGTDTYFIESSTDAKSLLSSDEIEVYVNGTKNTSIIPTVTLKQTLTEERTVGGETDSSVQYGVQYEIGLSGFASNANQVKIKILADAIIDQSGNGNKETEFIAYNVLKVAETGDTDTHEFLGGPSEAEIQRQNIEHIVFKNSLSGAPVTIVNGIVTAITDEAKAWDISAQQDMSIIAWTTNTSAPYTVNIGSNWEMFGNQNSSYLFKYIGYSSNCDDTTVFTNINLLNTKSVTDMSNMFQYCGHNAMTTFDLGDSFYTDNVTDMSYMFQYVGYTAMTSFSFGSKFNTSNVEEMSYMFKAWGYNVMGSETGKESLDLSTVTFNTAKVTNMEAMFQDCGYKTLKVINLGSNFDTSNVETMKHMFYYAGFTALRELNLGPKFDTSKVENMALMFAGVARTSTTFTTLDLGELFDTSHVEDMNSMFYRTGAKGMTTLDLGPKFDTSNVKIMHKMFYGCGQDKLTSLDLGNLFSTESAEAMGEMFYTCGQNAMTVLDLGPLFTQIPSGDASGNVTVWEISSGANKSVGANTNMFTNTGTSTCTIYAPEAIYEDLNSFKLQKVPTT